MTKKLFILVILLLVAMPAFSQVDTVWVRRYNGPGNLGDPASNIDKNSSEERLLRLEENIKGRSANDHSI